MANKRATGTGITRRNAIVSKSSKIMMSEMEGGGNMQEVQRLFWFEKCSNLVWNVSNLAWKWYKLLKLLNRPLLAGRKEEWWGIWSIVSRDCRNGSLLSSVPGALRVLLPGSHRLHQVFSIAFDQSGRRTHLAYLFRSSISSSLACNASIIFLFVVSNPYAV